MNRYNISQENLAHLLPQLVSYLAVLGPLAKSLTGIMPQGVCSPWLGFLLPGANGRNH